jgi:hypothetical protein
MIEPHIAFIENRVGYIAKYGNRNPIVKVPKGRINCIWIVSAIGIYMRWKISVPYSPAKRMENSIPYLWKFALVNMAELMNKSG